VINKIDLAAPDGEKLQHFEDLALEVLFCSAVTGEGLDGLLDRLSGKRSVLAGASGVGKSTIINAIIPGADAPTRAVRKKDQRGRHKTSNPTIYELAGGGIIVDTPGIRELCSPPSRAVRSRGRDTKVTLTSARPSKRIRDSPG